MKLRSLAIGLTLLTAGAAIGVTTQQFASADVSSGDRPVLVPIVPCRLVDTRPGDATVGPRSSRLGAADTMTVDAQQAGTDCTGVIPADALSLSLNVTAIGATHQTFLTIWAGGLRPGASSLNPAPGAPPTPNAVTVDLSPTQEFEIYNNLGSLNVLVDVHGYYEHHNHDDRYYTRAEVEGLISAGAPEVVTVEPSIDPFFQFEFVPEDYVAPTFDQTFTTTRPGRLAVDAYMRASLSCSGADDHIYMIEIDGVTVENSAFLRRDDADTTLVVLTGTTQQVVPAGEHTVRIGAECSGEASSASLNSASAFRVSSVVVFPE